MAKKPQRSADAVAILYRQTYQGKAERLKALEEARADEEIARKIYGLRTRAGLMQAQLGKLAGTTASVICRLEDGDYEGHSLAMLRRIAVAMNRRIEIRLFRFGEARSRHAPLAGPSLQLNSGDGKAHRPGGLCYGFATTV